VRDSNPQTQRSICLKQYASLNERALVSRKKIVLRILIRRRLSMLEYDSYWVVLRRIFGPKRDEVTEVWRKWWGASYFALFAKYYYDDQIMEDDMGGAYDTHWKDIKWVKILFRKSEGKRPLGRPRRRWDEILRRILEKQAANVWTRLNCLRTGSNGGVLWKW
jgi:homoserine trans-succinylase